MTEPTPRRRLAGRLMIAAGVLALPLTASISYAAADDPVAPPVPPAAPSAPAAPEKVEKRIVIVEKEGPATDDAKLKTRVVTRDGKTVVFKTDKDLSDAELDKKLEEALARVPDAPDAPGAPGEHRMIIRRLGPGAGPESMVVDAETVNLVGCKNGEASQVDEQSSADGKQHRIKIKICAAEQARAAAQAEVAAVQSRTAALEARTAAVHARVAAIEAIRSARAEVARDKGIPDDVRAKVLKSLDEEIKRAEKDRD